MCGITGIWQRRGNVARASIATFTDAIAHRGPDGFGYSFHREDTLALGHRRLSILDTSEAGAQPMHYAHLSMVFNGEVYNFLELRAELEQLGHRFGSDTDSEVVLHAYAEWGPDCLHRFNGMWALAIYDTRTETLFLARDRFGIKPLYYVDGPDRFSFASETIAWKYLPGFERRFDEAQLQTAFTDPLLLAGRQATIYADIRPLPAGHRAKLSARGFELEQWYAPPFSAPLDSRPVTDTELDRLAAELRDHFDAACRLRLRTDVPLASALSGGLDSSSVYANVNRLLREERVSRAPSAARHAFTLGFPGSERDETAAAAGLVRREDGRHHVVLSRHAPARIEALTRRFDTVYSDPNYIVCELYAAMRRADFKVSLDGHGVDEMLFGYPHMIRELRRWATTQDPALADRLGHLLRHQLAFQSTPPPRPLWRRALGRLRRQLRPAPPAAATAPVLAPHEILAHNFSNYFLPNILRNFDFASMQAGVEVRMPFLDHRLVAWVSRLPLRAHTDGWYSKRILRRAMEGYLPDDIRMDKNKIGIQAPLPRLLNGALRDWALDRLRSDRLRDSSYFDGRALLRQFEGDLVNQQLSAAACRRLWPYLNYSMLEL